MGVGAEHPGSPSRNRPRLALLPTTDLGKWAVGLGVAFFALVLGGSVVPRGAGLGLVCGVAGGVAAVVAIVRDGERGVSVFGAFVPLAIAVAFVVSESITATL